MPSTGAETLPAQLLASLKCLEELALELRISWDHSTDDIWRELDPELWELTRNPTLVLHATSETKLRGLAAATDYRRRLEDFVLARRLYARSPGWFQFAHPGAPLNHVAYFSMEFGVCEALPIYSGGLGNVAGDQLKASSDLGVPIIGVGLLYQQGYFRQAIDPHGNQLALYPYNAPAELPITPVRDRDGKLVRLELQFPGSKVWLRAWRANIGRVTLYLLDSNDGANMAFHRGITSELYGGGPELRLMQELVLGIGGWRLLQRLNIKTDVCHLNEGHAAFAVLERAACFMEQTGKPFEVALAATRVGNLFTTHTPVAAGFDRFDSALVTRYLESLFTSRLSGVATDQVLALGRRDPTDRKEPFNMAYLAIRGSGAINAVSRLHGAVSREIFADLFPRWPLTEVPVGHVTNGVHTPTWDSLYAQRLWRTASRREDPWSGTLEGIAEHMRAMSDDLLWGLRTQNRKELVQYVRERMEHQDVAAGGLDENTQRSRSPFDPQTLTLGFARRFATYKRPTLLLQHPERLARILTNPKFPVQLVIAGKAHPADEPGRAMIKQWVEFVSRPEVRPHVVFIADYDMIVAQHLVRGVDLWLNTPRRPWEASGTSGMKVLVNGGLNLSELDGWWAEAYAPEVGWAIGDGREHGDDAAWDAVEAESLYDVLEQEVIPMFYQRNEKGIPVTWLARMRESMARLTPQFSANRTVREYTEKYYLPAAIGYRKREANSGELAEEVLKWRHRVGQHWATISFGSTKVESSNLGHEFATQVYLNDLLSDSVSIELYAEPERSGAPVRIPLVRSAKVAGSVDGFVYTGRAPAARPASDYTVRVVPSKAGVLVPLEASSIIWQNT
ncbi:MAG: alpha-glucan family phosphorylase [Deltaproteobacteria bacterium]|nr:alpha-glucan family phosphorylase [Deltaproteobacteria bacterium]